MRLQRDVPAQFQVASKAAPEGASRAVPEAWVQCSSRGGPELLQRGGSRAAPDAGSSAAPEGGSRAAPEGVQCSSRGAGAPWAPNGQTSADPACPLLRGYVLTQAIDIFHVRYPLYLLVVQPIDTPGFSTGRGRGEVAGATPPVSCLVRPRTPFAMDIAGAGPALPTGRSLPPSDPCGKARIPEG